MPSCNTYHLTWVSLTLEVGYLFTAAPAKRSHCSLPWMRGISSLLPLLTLNVEYGQDLINLMKTKYKYNMYLQDASVKYTYTLFVIPK